MNRLAAVFAALAMVVLTGCAARLTLIDKSSGQSYVGTTGATLGGSGEASVSMDGELYSGPWIYSASGGSYSLGNYSGTASSFGTQGSSFSAGSGVVNAINYGASGSGLITMSGPPGSFIRCVFDFNTLSDTGIGQCQRNDGRSFDLMIRR